MHRAVGTWLVLIAGSAIFGDAFALGRWLPVPLIVTGLALAFVAVAFLFRGQWSITGGYFVPTDLFLLGFLVVVAVGTLFSQHLHQKNLNHTLGYTVTVLFYGLGLRFLMASWHAGVESRDRILRVIAFSTLLLCVYTILEFVNTNFGGGALAQSIPFPGELKPYEPRFLIFVRARGFEAESAFLALYLNCFLPLSLAYARSAWSRRWQVALALAGGLAMMLTFSVAGLLACVVAGGATLVSYFGLRRPPLRGGTAIRIAVAILAVSAVVATVVPRDAIEAVTQKLTLSGGQSSAARLRAWGEAFGEFRAHPVFGAGIGSSSAETGKGSISLYLTLLREVGLAGLFVFLASFAIVPSLAGYLLRRSALGPPLLMGFLAATIQYAVIANIWYPWIWMLFALMLNERAFVQGRSGQTLRGGEPSTGGDGLPSLSASVQ